MKGRRKEHKGSHVKSWEGIILRDEAVKVAESACVKRGVSDRRGRED